MKRSFRPCLLLVAAICFAPFLTNHVQAQTGQTETQVAFDAMNAWLSQSDHAAGWRAYLQAGNLAAQLQKGDQADLEVLEKQLELYSGSNSGLRKSQFTDVRDALQRWIDELQLPAEDELVDEAAEAVDELEPLDEERLTQAKQRLVDEAASFERYLQRGGDAKVEGWKRYLQWEDFAPELEAEDPQRDYLVRTWALLASGSQGVNNREVVQLREALRN